MSAIVVPVSVPGKGVTVLNGGAEVSALNPFPVSAAIAPPTYLLPFPVNPTGAAQPWAGTAQAEVVNNAVANGDTSLVAGVAGKVIYITGFTYSGSKAADVFFRSAAAGTQISAMAKGAAAWDDQAATCEPYLFKTGVGAALVLNLNVGGAFSGSVQVRYRQV